MSVKVYNNQSTFTGLEILKLHNLKKKIIFKFFLKKEKLWINERAVFYRSNPMRYVYKFGKEDIYKNFTWFNFSFLLKVSLTCSKEVSHTTLHFFFISPNFYFYISLVHVCISTEGQNPTDDNLQFKIIHTGSSWYHLMKD